MNETKMKALREAVDAIAQLYEYHLREHAVSAGKHDLEVIKALVRTIKDEDYDAWYAMTEYAIAAENEAYRRVYGEDAAQGVSAAKDFPEKGAKVY